MALAPSPDPPLPPTSGEFHHGTHVWPLRTQIEGRGEGRGKKKNIIPPFVLPLLVSSRTRGGEGGGNISQKKRNVSDLLKWTFFSPLLNVLLREGGERTRKEARYGACVRKGMREEASSLQVTFFPHMLPLSLFMPSPLFKRETVKKLAPVKRRYISHSNF